MQPFASLWSALDPRRRVIVVLATVAVFAGVLLLSRAASTPGMSLLYAGLEGKAAGEVITALEQRGIEYSVRGAAIYVPDLQRDELRMSLAAEGLPATGGTGYELLDGLSGFGTTSQMFDAAFWRAKEGELARTILALPGIRSARVHISVGSAQGFQRQQAATASVTLITTGGAVSSVNARALRHLVASAVPGLTPEHVSVIDGERGLVLAGDQEEGAGATDDRAETMRRNVERLLAARVGPGRAVVELSLDTVTERESILEKRFDPQGRVAISSETEERTTSSNASKTGSVTVASNLPEGDAAQGGGSSSENSETRERTNFEVSETQREVIRAPGAVRRVTVAVIVDGARSQDDNGTDQWTPLPEEELAALRELVASAVGFDEARGDVITLKSMPLQLVQEGGTEAATGGLAALGLDLMSVLQMAVLAIVTMVLGLFVVRPILAGRANSLRVESTNALPAPEGPVTAGTTGELLDENGTTLPALTGNRGESADLSDGTADPIARLRRLIEERQQETVEILRNWMEDREERA